MISMREHALRYKTHIIPILALLALTVAIYARSFGHSFLDNWDDKLYVVNNQTIRGLTWANLRDAFSNYYAGNYAPMQIVSYMLDYELWGLNPAGFIATSILFHALNGILFYGLMLRLTGNRLTGFVAAFVFIAHPVQVESVVWISQRKNVLCMLFFLTSFHLYLAARSADSSSALLLRIAAVLSFVLSLLSKSVAVIFPLVLIAYDFCHLEPGRWRKNLQGKLPYIVAALLVGIVALISQGRMHEGGRVSYHGGSPLATAMTMLTVFSRYLINLACPLQLSAIYPLPIRTGIDTEVVLSFILLVLALILCALLCKRRSPAGFWFLFFFVALLPVMNIIPIVTLMNDRYCYFPMIGAAACFGLLVTPLGGWRWRFLILQFAAIAILFVLPLLAMKRVQVWQNSISLWSATYAEVGDGYGYDCNKGFIANALANSYLQEGLRRSERKNSVEARWMFLQALVHEPDNYGALGNLGAMFLDQGKPLLARKYLERLTKTFRRSAIGFRLLGYSYLATEDWRGADAAFRRALELAPENAELQRALQGELVKIKTRLAESLPGGVSVRRE